MPTLSLISQSPTTLPHYSTVPRLGHGHHHPPRPDHPPCSASGCPLCSQYPAWFRAISRVFVRWWLAPFRDLVPETWLPLPLFSAPNSTPAQATATGLPRYRVSFWAFLAWARMARIGTSEHTDADPKSMSNAQISPDGPRCYIRVQEPPEDEKS